MGSFFSKYYFGGPFETFDVPHLITLGVILGGNLLLFAYRAHFTDKARRWFRLSLAVVLILCQLAWIIWLIVVGEATLERLVPLQLCPLFVFLSAVMLITRSYSIYEYAYFLGGGGAIHALISPDIGMYGFPHFIFLQTMLLHGCLLTTQVYMTVIEGFRPTWRSYIRCFLGANLYIGIVFLINFLTGSNYLFLMQKPEFPNLLEVFGTFPWYIFGIEVVSILTSLILYFPFAFIDCRQKVNIQKAD
jgi:hypothetical integral membrane protein (TIGR02206 family)